RGSKLIPAGEWLQRRARQANFHDPVPRLDASRIRRAFRKDVANFLTQLRVVAYRDDAKERVREGSQHAAQLQVRQIAFFLAAPNLDGDRVALVLGTQNVQDLGLIDYWLAVNLHNHIAGPD